MNLFFFFIKKMNFSETAISLLIYINFNFTEMDFFLLQYKEGNWGSLEWSL